MTRPGICLNSRKVCCKTTPSLSAEAEPCYTLSFLEGMASQSSGNPALTQADGVHPTTAGYKIVVETVYPYVLEAINQLSRS
jgi:acyl-CoA thioesterase-1